MTSDADLLDAVTRQLGDAWESIAGSPIHAAVLGRALLMAPYPDVAAAVLDVAALAAREPMSGHLAEALISRELGRPAPRRPHRRANPLQPPNGCATLKKATASQPAPRLGGSDLEADPSARSEAPDLAPCALGDRHVSK
jgi:hypothetical protein